MCDHFIFHSRDCVCCLHKFCQFVIFLSWYNNEEKKKKGAHNSRINSNDEKENFKWLQMSRMSQRMVLQLISLKNCRTSSLLLPSLSSSLLSTLFSSLLLLCADWELKLVPRPSIALKPKGLLHNFPSFFFSREKPTKKLIIIKWKYSQEILIWNL